MSKLFRYLKAAAMPMPIIFLTVVAFGVSALLNTSTEEIIFRGLETTAITIGMYFVGFVMLSYWNGD